MDTTLLIFISAALFAVNLLDATVRNTFTTVLNAVAFTAAILVMLFWEAKLSEVLLVIMIAAVFCIGMRLAVGRKNDK